VPALTEALTNANPQVRFWAVTTLGNMREVARDAVPELLHCLEDGDPNVRGSAAVAAVQIGGDPEVIVPPLVRCLGDEKFGDRIRVVFALRSLHPKPEEMLPALFAFLNQQPADSPPVLILTAIGDYGTNALPFVPALEDMIETNRFIKSEDLIMTALSKIDEKKAWEIHARRYSASTNAPAR